jgi:hypothetical protein
LVSSLHNDGSPAFEIGLARAQSARMQEHADAIPTTGARPNALHAESADAYGPPLPPATSWDGEHGILVFNDFWEGRTRIGAGGQSSPPLIGTDKVGHP